MVAIQETLLLLGNFFWFCKEKKHFICLFLHNEFNIIRFSIFVGLEMQMSYM